MNVTYTQNLTEIYDSQHTAKQQLLNIYMYKKKKTDEHTSRREGAPELDLPVYGKYSFIC